MIRFTYTGLTARLDSIPKSNVGKANKRGSNVIFLETIVWPAVSAEKGETPRLGYLVVGPFGAHPVEKKMQ